MVYKTIPNKSGCDNVNKKKIYCIKYDTKRGSIKKCLYVHKAWAVTILVAKLPLTFYLNLSLNGSCCLCCGFQLKLPGPVKTCICMDETSKSVIWPI